MSFYSLGAFSLHKHPTIMSHLANHKIPIEIAYVIAVHQIYFMLIF
jgi:hypothetical protein